MQRDGVVLARGDQCPFGAVVHGKDGLSEVARKRTGWLTNCLYVAETVAVICANWVLPEEEQHEHSQVLNGKAKELERYPLALVVAILKGIRKALQARRSIGAMEAGPHLDDPGALELYGGDEEFSGIFDRVSGAELNGKAVAAARETEMDYMRQLVVFTYAPEEESYTVCGVPPLPLDWVDVNKGDSENPEIRSRLVAMDTKKRTSIDPTDISATFAATPPLEGLRAVISITMSTPYLTIEELVVMIFLDISRAHLHSLLEREVYGRPPPEDLECPPGMVWKFLKAIYGLKDAGNAFDHKSEQVMVLELGFEQGCFSIYITIPSGLYEYTGMATISSAVVPGRWLHCSRWSLGSIS
jgi:hypothetical protein